MSAAWERGVVRILPAGSDPAVTPPKGAGFLAWAPPPDGAAPVAGIIVTCAHVVLACRPRNTQDRPSSVRVIFDATGDALEATVDPAGWRPPGGGDIAILRIAGPLPADLEGLPLGSSLTAEGHNFRTIGYPDEDMSQEVGTGTIEAVPRGLSGIRSIQLSSEQVTTGYSGGPVWDEQLRRVVGMVSEIVGPDAYGRGASVAYATPAEALVDACPELAIRDECPYRGLEPFDVGDARFYFGRREAIDRVLDRLRDGPSVVAIFGPSGSGKSSLVRAGVIPRLSRDEWCIPETVRRYDDIDAELAMPADGQVHRRTLVVLDQFEEALAAGATGDRRPILERLARLIDRPATTVMIVMRNDFYSRFVTDTPDPLRAAALANLIEMPVELTHADLLAMIGEPARAVGLRFQDGLAELIARDALATGGTTLPLLEFALTQLWRERDIPYLTHQGYTRIGGVGGGLTQWADDALRELSSGPSDRRQIARRIMVSLVHVGDEATGVPDSRTSRTTDELAADDDMAEVRAVIDELEEKRLLVTSAGRDGAPQRVQLVHDALIRRWDTLKGWLNEDRAFKLWEQAMQPRAVRWKLGSGTLLRDGELAEAERWLATKGGELEHPLPEWIEASIAARREAERAARAARERLRRLATGMTVAALLFLGVSILALVLFLRAEHESTLNRVQSMAAQAQLSERGGSDEQSALLAREAWLLDEDHELPGPVGTALQGSIGSPYFSTLSPPNPSAVRSIAYAADGRTMALARDDGTIEVATPAGAVACAAPASGGTAPPLRAIQVALNADGTVLAAGSGDGAVHLWRLAGASCAFDRSLTGPGGAVTTVAIGTLGDDPVLAIGSCRIDPTTSEPPSPFARRAGACASGGAWVRVWALRTEPALLADRPIDGTFGCAIAIDSRGGWLAASGCGDVSPETPICSANRGSIARWPLDGVASAPACLTEHRGDVRALAFGPCGGLLASGGDDRTIRLWDPATATLDRTLTGHTEAVRGLAISRDCAYLGSASEDGSVGLWYLPEDDPIVGSLGTSTQWVRTIAFGGADGDALAAEAPGGRVRTWHLGHRGDVPGELRGHEAYIRALAFSPRPGDLLLASGAEDGTLRLWDLKRPWTEPVLAGFGDDPAPAAVTAVAFSYDGRFLAAADGDGHVWLWDVATPERPMDSRRIPAGGDVALAFHPGAYQLAVGTRGGFVHLWSVALAGVPALVPVGEPVEAERGTAITALAFTPDGGALAAGSANGRISVWPWRQDGLAAMPSYRLDGTTRIRALAYSPDGTMLASGGDDGLVRLWDADARYRLLATLAGHEDEVRSLAFTPDGETLASGSRDQTVRLWSMGRLSSPPVVVLGASEWVRALAISPDGEVLAAAATQGRIRLLIPDSDTLAERVCERVTRNLSETEWSELAGPDQPYHRTCPGIPTPEPETALATG